MKTLFLLVAVSFFGTLVNAQQKPAVGFNSYNSAGFIAGKLPIAFTAQTENGLTYKNWFFGAGLGLDNYFIKTLPLFASVKKEFLLKKNSLFLYVNGGGQFVAKDKKISNAFSSIVTEAGSYYDAGLGYKIKTTKKSSVFFTLGNTYKTVRQTETSLDTGFPFFYVTEYKLSRISFRAGYQF
jgi:hypothetical protein